jgi:hypothetical protein
MQCLHAYPTCCTPRITGETAEQYLSSMNAAYATTGLQPPAKPAGSWRLHHDVRMALAGFTEARLEGGGRDPKCHVPTTTEVIERICYLTLKALDREVLPMAQAALANVWQYFNFSRPTMTASLDWDRLEFLSAVKVQMTIPRVASGRKNTGLKKKTLGFFDRFRRMSGSTPAGAEDPSYRIDWLLPAHCRSRLLAEALRWPENSMATSRGDCDCGEEV